MVAAHPSGSHNQNDADRAIESANEQAALDKKQRKQTAALETGLANQTAAADEAAGPQTHEAGKALSNNARRRQEK